MQQLYYILSLKRGPVGNDAMWWRPGAAGYTSHLNDAGMFNAEEVAGFNLNEAESVPIAMDMAEAHAHLAVGWSELSTLVKK